MDMEPEDTNTVIDLRSLNCSTGRVKYDVFGEHCSRVLNDSVGTAVDDRRHGTVVHLAQAISIRDFPDQVTVLAQITTLETVLLVALMLNFNLSSRHAKVLKSRNLIANSPVQGCCIVGIIMLKSPLSSLYLCIYTDGGPDHRVFC